MSEINCCPPARAVTAGPHHHFFGYYDKCPWDASGRYMLGLETTFINRHPRWSRDGRQVCIDSVHEGERQIYVLDVAGIVKHV